MLSKNSKRRGKGHEKLQDFVNMSFKHFFTILRES